jgi:hypothetical protein
MAQSQLPRCRATADTGGLRAIPGPRLTYRVRGQGQFKPIEKFIASAQQHLQARNRTTDGELLRLFAAGGP